ncbi:MAG: chemotaxis protein CheW [Gemmataceae bacterium]
MVEKSNSPDEAPAAGLPDIQTTDLSLPLWVRDKDPVAAEGLPLWLNSPHQEPLANGPLLEARSEIQPPPPEPSPPLPSSKDPLSDPEIDLFAKPAEDASFLNLSAVYVRDLLKISSKCPSPGTSDECPESTLGSEGEAKEAGNRDQPNAPAVPMERQPPLSRLVRPVVYGIEVPNTGTKPLFQVRVEHDLPAGFRFLGADPVPDIRRNKLVWKLGDLEPQSAKRILVRVQPKHAGKLLPESATTFRTTYGVRTRITKPRLQATVTGPQCVDRGEPAIFEIEVSNSGTGQATNVCVRNQIPAGLLHDQGHLVESYLGTLSPGETVKLYLRTIAQGTGAQVTEVIVSGSECVSVAIQAQVLVKQAELTLQITGPTSLQPNQETDYLLEIFNTGTAAASSILVDYKLPEGLDFVSADEQAIPDPNAQSVSWSFASLAAGQNRLLPIRVRTQFPGDFLHKASLRYGEGPDAAAELLISSDLAIESSPLLAELLAGIDGPLRASRTTRGNAARIPAQLEAAGKDGQHIVFTLAGIDYAVPMAGVVEIGRASNITPVPNVREWLLGVANVRGDVISMVNLGMFFGLDKCTETTDSRLLVVRSRWGDMATGLLVEKVKGIRSISEKGIMAPASTFENRLTPYLRGVAENDGRLLVLLDLDKLLLSAEMRQVELV